MILANKKLEEALKAGDIVIDPRPKEFKAASIDLTLGEEAFIASKDSVKMLDTGKLFC